MKKDDFQRAHRQTQHNIEYKRLQVHLQHLRLLASAFEHKIDERG